MPSTGSPPSPEEAALLLAAADQTRRRARRSAVQSIWRMSLVWWGLDWLAGYAVSQFRPGWFTLGLWAVLSLALYGISHYTAQDAPVFTGWEAAFHRSWWVILLGSASCLALVEPQPFTSALLLLGAIWGIAYALFGVVVGDGEIAALGGWFVVLAVVLRFIAAPFALLLYGIGAGGASVALGLVRMRREQ